MELLVDYASLVERAVVILNQFADCWLEISRFWGKLRSGIILEPAL